MPADQPTTSTKKVRKTNLIACFNNTRRQHLFRFVRATLSFSKTVEYPIGASKWFICRYNLAKAAAYLV
jgi:IS1 family transposase